MDESIPLRVRQRYALLSFSIFVVVLVAASLYADGYRVRSGHVATTGAINVYAPISGATVTVDGKEAGKSGLLSHAVYVGDLKPGTHTVSAGADGYLPWQKSLIVEPKFVSETSTFLVPLHIEVVPVSAQDIVSVAAFFATSSLPVHDGGLALTLEHGDVILTWVREQSEAPQVFCIAPSSCAQSFTVKQGGLPASAAAFFAGGVVYRTSAGVFITEADIKKSRVVAPLYPSSGSDFRIDHRHLYIKDASRYYEVTNL